MATGSDWGRGGEGGSGYYFFGPGSEGGKAFCLRSRYWLSGSGQGIERGHGGLGGEGVSDGFLYGGEDIAFVAEPDLAFSRMDIYI